MRQTYRTMTRYSTLSPLPERIARLEELALDLWWSWHLEARIVFRRLDYQLWRATAHNPARMLWLIPREKLEAAAIALSYRARNSGSVAAASSFCRGICHSMRAGLCAVVRHSW